MNDSSMGLFIDGLTFEIDHVVTSIYVSSCTLLVTVEMSVCRRTCTYCSFPPPIVPSACMRVPHVSCVMGLFCGYLSTVCVLCSRILFTSEIYSVFIVCIVTELLLMAEYFT